MKYDALSDYGIKIYNNLKYTHIVEYLKTMPVSNNSNESKMRWLFGPVLKNGQAYPAPHGTIPPFLNMFINPNFKNKSGDNLLSGFNTFICERGIKEPLNASFTYKDLPCCCINLIKPMKVAINSYGKYCKDLVFVIPKNSMCVFTRSRVVNNSQPSVRGSRLRFRYELSSPVNGLHIYCKNLENSSMKNRTHDQTIVSIPWTSIHTDVEFPSLDPDNNKIFHGDSPQYFSLLKNNNKHFQKNNIYRLTYGPKLKHNRYLFVKSDNIPYKANDYPNMVIRDPNNFVWKSISKGENSDSYRWAKIRKKIRFNLPR